MTLHIVILDLCIFRGKRKKLGHTIKDMLIACSFNGIECNGQ